MTKTKPHQKPDGRPILLMPTPDQHHRIRKAAADRNKSMVRFVLDLALAEADKILRNGD